MSFDIEHTRTAAASRRRLLMRRLFFGSLVVASAIGASGPAAQHRAHLSDDLLRHGSSRSSTRARVIVHGDRGSLEALAARHGVGVVRWLDGGAVLRLNGRELSALAADRTIDHLSADAIVRTAMKISNP